MCRHTAVQRVGRKRETDADRGREVGNDCIVSFAARYSIAGVWDKQRRVCSPSRSILSCIDHRVAPLREPDKNLWGEIEQLCRQEHGPVPDLNHGSVLPAVPASLSLSLSFCSLCLSLGSSVSSFQSNNGSTNGHRWGGRPRRLPNVLKVKSRARCVRVRPVPAAGQIKQLSIIPR